jgi:hypothetical protein
VRVLGRVLGRHDDAVADGDRHSYGYAVADRDSYGYGRPRTRAT